jgi:hypothetical protein
MSHVRTTLATLTLLTGLALSGCSGSGGDDDDVAEACSPGDGQALRALADDKSALPADNWVPVVGTRDGYRDALALLDQASQGFSSEDLQAVLAASDTDRAAVLEQAASDLPEGRAGAGVIRLQVPDGATARAVASYYRVALDRLGARVSVERAEVGPALEALPDDERAATAVVLTGLSELAGAVGAELPEGGDASAQVQAVATAALTQDLALGSTAAASGTARVLVPDALVSAKSLVTISDLAKACDGAVVAVAGDDDAAAQAVADAYGLTVGPSVTDPADAFTGSDDSDAPVAVVAAGS